jgi:light-regulated signal transduction histidine kinase (bacteriophytochrome)
LVTDADRRLMQVALENLLGNAWKFTSKREHAEIAVGRMTGEHEPVFYVRDNGAGFDMRYANKLFNPFQRLHSTDDFAGTGIGLATVYRVIDRHGGRVWAQSAPDQGATFFFTLPASRARLQ